MYYKEEIIDGILCRKYTPEGEWKQFTAEELSERIVKLKKQLYDSSKD
jgi:hypothetical protein